MAFCRATISVIAAVACVFGANGLSQSMSSLTAAQQQDSQPVQTTASNDSSRIHRGSVPNNIVVYENFMQYLGTEDDKLQSGSQRGSSASSEKIDYSSAIGISWQETQSVLSVLLDAYHRRAINDKQAKDNHQSPQIVMGQENFTILLDAWKKLKETLPPESFKKLDSYVSTEFGPGPYPSSYRASIKPIPVTPFPVDVRYEFFIERIAAEEAVAQRDLQMGIKDDPRDTYSLKANFPRSEEAAVRAILIDAWKQLQDNNQQVGAALGALVQQYGLQSAAQMAVPPEIQNMYAQHDKIIEDTINRLKLELGSEYFGHLDAWVNKTYYGGSVIDQSAMPNSTTVQPAGIQSMVPALHAPHAVLVAPQGITCFDNKGDIAFSTVFPKPFPIGETKMRIPITAHFVGLLRTTPARPDEPFARRLR